MLWTLPLCVLFFLSTALGETGTDPGNLASRIGGQLRKTDEEYGNALLQLSGLRQTACNDYQRSYIDLMTAQTWANLMDAHCVARYYIPAKSFADVNAWLTCESIALSYFLPMSRITSDYNIAHYKEIHSKCDVNTDGTNPKATASAMKAIHEFQVTLNFINEAWNFMTPDLISNTKGWFQGKILDKVKEGVMDATGTVIDAAVTKGYPTTLQSKQRRAFRVLLERQSADDTTYGNATSLVKTPIELTLRISMIPVNSSYTFQQLGDSVKALFSNPNTTADLKRISANITNYKYSVVPGNTSIDGTTASGTGTGPVAAASSSSSAQRTVAQMAALGSLLGALMAWSTL